MSEVVICDTNAVIQLAIICPDCFKGKELLFVVHSIVKQEIYSLRKDPEKEKRLKSVFDFIQKSISTNNTQKFPNRQKEQQLHYMILRFERGLSPELTSAGSSENDRKFLMLAKENKSILLTNERTLFNLGKALLKDQETWRVGEAIERIRELKIISDKDIQNGLDRLEDFQEFLSSECATKVRRLGFKY